MPASEANTRTQISNLIHAWEEFRKFAGTATPNYIGLENTYVTALDTTFYGEAMGALQGARGTLASFITQIGSCLAPLLREYGQVIGCPETDIQRIFDRLFQYFITNAYTIASRNITLGAVTPAVGNVGTGTIHRLYYDQDSQKIENVTVESKAMKCVSDGYSGATIHEEVFEFRGEDAERDLLKITGSGKVKNISALSGLTASNYLSNPSFDQYSGTIAVPTAITDWTPLSGVYTGLEIDQTNYYRNFRGASTPGSLKMKANETVTQKFSVRNLQLNPNVPMFLQLAFNREVGTGDGTITLTVGNKTVSVAMAAQTGWNTLVMPMSSAYQWFKLFNVTNPGISVQLSGRTTGYVLIDDIIFAPMTNFDGWWWAVVGGATKFLRDDNFTTVDTEVGSVLQTWFWRALGRYLPSTVGAPTWPDP
jgi:hypothetical protein